jgi:branched-chain amino acid transport system permease protein
VNIAHSVFIFAAAFLSYQLNQWFDLDPLITIAINMPVMFIAGMIIYRLLLARDVNSPRYTEMTVLITFALALMIEGGLTFIFTGTVRSVRPSYGIEAEIFDFAGGRIIIPHAQLYSAVASLVLVGLLWTFLQYTRTGYAIRATMQNRTAAQTVGVDVVRVSTIAFGIGTALAGASGALMSFRFSFFPAGHWEWVALLLSLIVLGGMGNLLGAVIGALALAVVAAFVSNEFGATWSPLTFYLSLFVILLVRPHGLFGKRLEAG